MIPLSIIVLIIQAAFALATVIGYRQLEKHPKRGHLLIGLGSAGLVVVAPNEVFQALSLYWTWSAAVAYQKCSQNGPRKR